jgi:hypothetical protein
MLLRNDSLHIHLNIEFNIHSIIYGRDMSFMHLNVNGRGMSFKDTKQVIYGRLGLNHNDVKIDIT